MPVPGRLSQCVLTSRATSEGGPRLLILDVAHTSRLVAFVTSPCATHCIGPAVTPTLPNVALPHAILVSLSEQPGSGYELAHRFDRSIGYFWAATHQQIYRTLRAMEADGWVHVDVV